jgi:hypothetical protein
MAGAGKDRQPGGGLVQRGQGMDTGGGDVVHRAGFHLKDPQREPVRGAHRLDGAAVGVRLARVPQAGDLARDAEGRFLAPVAGDDLPVQIPCGKPSPLARSSPWRRPGAPRASTMMTSSR